MERVRYLVNIVTIVLLFTAIAIQRDGRMFGHDVASLYGEQEESESDSAVERIGDDGSLIINSSSLASDVIGYGGRTPVEIHIKGGRITHIETLTNSETPSFMESVSRDGFFDRWIGMSLDEAVGSKVDVVSGATYSSIALSENIRRAAQYADSSSSAEAHSPLSGVGAKEIAGLLVLLTGVVLTLTRSRNKILRATQLALNVVVLGVWCGSFLSLSSFVAWAGNGFNLAVAGVTVVMFAITLLMPLFGRKGSYCANVCPMGSAQELVWMLPIKGITIPPKVAKVLGRVRYYILLALLLMMWVGVGFEIMEYEVFSAFIFGSASTFVLWMAGVSLLLSLFTPRPYCRFVCPTGALITLSQKSNQE